MITPGMMVAVTLASSAPASSVPAAPAVASGEESAETPPPFAALLLSASEEDRVAVAESDEMPVLEWAGEASEDPASARATDLAPVDGAVTRDDDAPLMVASIGPEILAGTTGPAPDASPIVDEATVELAPLAVLQVAPQVVEDREAPSPAPMDRAILSTLQRSFADRLVRVADRMWAEHGMSVQLIEGHRSQSRQDQLFAQGRTEPGPVVTWTRSSLHSVGQAADLYIDGAPITPEAATLLARLARQEGLATLYPFDSGHIQMDRGGGHAGPEGPLPRVGSTIEPAAAPAPARGVAPIATVAPVARPARPGGPGGDDPLAMAQGTPPLDGAADPDGDLRSGLGGAVVGAMSGSNRASARPSSAATVTNEAARVAELTARGVEVVSDGADGSTRDGPSDSDAGDDRRRAVARAVGSLTQGSERAATADASTGPTPVGEGARTGSGSSPIVEGSQPIQPLVVADAARSGSAGVRSLEALADPWSGTVERVAEVVAMRANGNGSVTHRVRIPIAGLGSAASVHLTLRGEVVDAEVRVADIDLADRLSTQLGELRTRLTTVGVEARDVMVRLTADASDVLVRTGDLAAARTQTASKDGASLGNPSHRSGREADPDQEPRREPAAEDEEQPR